jgi:hypothetical protein
MAKAGFGFARSPVALGGTAPERDWPLWLQLAVGIANTKKAGKLPALMPIRGVAGALV